jgi:hypothetical protein
MPYRDGTTDVIFEPLDFIASPAEGAPTAQELNPLSSRVTSGIYVVGSMIIRFVIRNHPRHYRYTPWSLLR